MTIYAPTWCRQDPAHPERPLNPCDPCGCFAQRADYASVVTNPLLEIDFNCGGMQRLCLTPIIWPFIKRSAPDLLIGASGYYPMGNNLRGALQIAPGTWLNSVEKVQLTYLGAAIFNSTITHEFIGDNGAGGWLYQNIISDPAPTQSFKMRYADALSIANQIGLSIQQFFGDYTQATPPDGSPPHGPIELTGFVYTGPLDEQQDKIVHASSQNVSGPSGWGFALSSGVLYYGPSPITARRRIRVPLVGRAI